MQIKWVFFSTNNIEEGFQQVLLFFLVKTLRAGIQLMGEKMNRVI